MAVPLHTYSPQVPPVPHSSPVEQFWPVRTPAPVGQVGPVWQLIVPVPEVLVTLMQQILLSVQSEASSQVTAMPALQSTLTSSQVAVVVSQHWLLSSTLQVMPPQSIWPGVRVQIVSLGSGFEQA